MKSITPRDTRQLEVLEYLLEQEEKLGTKSKFNKKERYLIRVRLDYTKETYHSGVHKIRIPEKLDDFLYILSNNLPLN